MMMLHEIILKMIPDAKFSISIDDDGNEYLDYWPEDQNSEPKPSKTKIKNAIKKYEKEVKEKLKRKESKIDREREIHYSTVETDIGIWNANEKSQDRMVRFILTMDDKESVEWIMFDDTKKQVTKQNLIEALRLARDELSRIWLKND